MKCTFRSETDITVGKILKSDKPAEICFFFILMRNESNCALCSLVWYDITGLVCELHPNPDVQGSTGTQWQQQANYCLVLRKCNHLAASRLHHSATIWCHKKHCSVWRIGSAQVSVVTGRMLNPASEEEATAWLQFVSGTRLPSDGGSTNCRYRNQTIPYHGNVPLQKTNIVSSKIDLL